MMIGKPGWIRWPALALAATLCASGGSARVMQAPQRSAQERQLDIDSFEHLWKTIFENHFDPTFGGVDWKAVRLDFLPKIAAAPGRQEVRALMRGMLARLKLTHFSILPSELYEGTSQAGRNDPGSGATGVTVRVIDGHALVVSVDGDSPAARAGVKPGWEIVQIGKQEIPTRLVSIAKEFEGSTLKDLILSDAVAGRLEGSVGDRMEASFLDSADKTVPLALQLAAPKGSVFQIGHLPEGRVWIDTRTIGQDIGYIAFNAFIAPGLLMPPFNDAMKRFMETKGIILDLRGNTGGQGDILTGMAGWLIAEKGRYFGTIQMRNQVLKLVVRPRPEVYAGRVAVLVDGLSLCATEIFAGGLRDLGRARIFGSHTGGAALGGSVEMLPNGDRFMYAFANYVTAGGHVLEGQGLIPDVDVRHTRAALLQGRDLPLEAAIDWITKDSAKK